MLQKNISKSTLYFNRRKYELWWELTNYIDTWNIDTLIQKLETQYSDWVVCVLWWDWTLLKVIQEVHSWSRPILWMNFGTKWFLLHAIDEIEDSETFILANYPLLESEVTIWAEKKQSFSFNEIDIRANTGKIIELDICISWSDNWKSICTNLKWDGLVFSTPAWSTGYNFSLGGPIIPHELRTFVLTPKAPWLPRYFKSVLINNTKKVTIKNTWRLSDIKIVCDGSDFLEIKDEEITIEIKKSDSEIQLLIPEKQSIAWKDKIFLEQNFS